MNGFEKEIFGTLFGESDDFDDLEMPEIDEEGSGGNAVDTMLAAINTGDTDSIGDEYGDDDDLAELEKEFQLTSAGGGIDPDESDNDIDIDATLDECGSEFTSDDLEEALPVSPELDRKGDIELAHVITEPLIEQTLDEVEYEEFIESGDAHVAASEGFIHSGYVMEAMEESFGVGDVFEESARFSPEGKKWKMTKSARLKQLFESSLQIEARLHKDPDWARMQKIYAARRKIRNNWRTRYGALAMRRAKRYLKALMKSNSSAMNKLASRLTGKK